MPTNNTFEALVIAEASFLLIFREFYDIIKLKYFCVRFFRAVRSDIQ